MTSSSTTDLARLGDDLERATLGHLNASRRRKRAARGAIAAIGIALLVTASASAAGLFTPRQVAAGLPASAVIFDGTHPTCAVDADGATYRCVLDGAPGDDSLPVSVPPEKVVAPTAADWTNAKEPLAIDGVIAGGCVGRSRDGLAWDCYIGTDAVDQLILTQDMLGQPMTGPSRG